MKRSSQGTSKNEGNKTNQQSGSPSAPLQLDDWLDPFLMDDDILELPPNDGFGLIPMSDQSI